MTMNMHNPPHPGEVLRDLCLEPLGLTITDAAAALGVSRKTLSAILNGRANQKFIVDTGASMVTIPRSTAEELGLEVDTSNPVRKVFTAGGVKYAPEVTLFSISVEGWEVTELKALVLDLPNQSEWGLLGMNYLRQFRMDINSDAGVLLLEPR